jgi:hypothetical protein
MTNAADIRTAMQSVVAVTGLGEACEIATMIDNKTFSDYTASTVILTELRADAIDSEDGRGKIHEHTQTARFSDAVTLSLGDRVKLSDGSVWVVAAKISGAYGSNRYEIRRSEEKRIGPARGRNL